MTKNFAEWQKAASEIRPVGDAFIDGAYVPALSGKTFEKTTSIDGSRIASVAACEAADIDRAVASARQAFEDGRWRNLDPKEKKRILLRFADAMRRDVETLALLEALDTGRPISDAVNVDVAFAADCIAYYAEFADKMFDEVAPTGTKDLALVRREALGVIGAVVPWNYPLIITAWKLGPALVAGNSVVLKPAEQSPLSAIRLAKLAFEAGLPAGVLNVVPGFGEAAGKPLALHPDVDMIAFTGSTEVGKLMMRYAGESNLKRLGLECGGKSPVVVLADADIEAAAVAVAWGIYYNQGQTCHACSRVVVDRRVKDDLIAAIGRVASSLKLGHPLDPATQLGALIDAKHCDRVAGYIDIGLKEGAKLALGGKVPAVVAGGAYLVPTVLDEIVPTMRVAQEEIFGPVLVVIPFDDEDEALRIANDSVYGLAAGVFTRDMNKAHRFTSALKAGSVWVNTYDRSNLSTPFGGFKQSGFGRDRSPHAIDKYTDFKTVWTAYT
jgi:acyl-CoA reductase-like NAD-dependent aldehyde dehydrogenase